MMRAPFHSPSFCQVSNQPCGQPLARPFLPLASPMQRALIRQTWLSATTNPWISSSSSTSPGPWMVAKYKSSNGQCSSYEPVLKVIKFVNRSSFSIRKYKSHAWHCQPLYAMNWLDWPICMTCQEDEDVPEAKHHGRKTWILEACPNCRCRNDTGPKILHHDFHGAINIRHIFLEQMEGRARPHCFTRGTDRLSNSPSDFHPV